MTLAIVAVLGLLLGGTAIWFVQRPRILYLERELRTATDRLVHAWKEGAVIPAREVEEPEPVAIPKDLQEEIDQWDDPESKAVARAQIEQMLREGKSQALILRALETPKLS